MAEFNLTLRVHPQDDPEKLGYYILQNIWPTDNKNDYYSISNLKNLIEKNTNNWDWIKVECLIRKSVRHRFRVTKIVSRTVSKVTFIRNPLKFKLANQHEALFEKTWPKNIKMRA